MRRKQEKEEEKTRQMEENRRRIEEMKRKTAEEQKRKVEELKRRQEEEARQKEREIAQRKELEEKRRQEQKATLAIRRVIQKVRVATPDNFDELQKELQDEMAKEMESTGSQKQRMMEECEKGLEQARKRIEQLNEQRKKDEEKKEQEQKKHQELMERAKELVKELADLVDAAESALAKLKEMAAPLEDASDLSPAEVEAASKTCEEAGAEAKTMTKACTDFILQKGPEMKDPAGTPPGQQPSETKQFLAKLLSRINDASKTTEATILRCRGAKDRAARRATAREKTKNMESVFAKFDKDKDKRLNRKEVQAFSQSEYKFKVTDELLDRIWVNMVDDGSTGVTIEHFQWLKVTIGTARELVRDGKRRGEREKNENIIKKRKTELQDKVKGVADAVDRAEQAVVKCETQVKPLLVQAKKMATPDMKKLADETDDLIKKARVAMVGARQELDKVGADLDVDLKAFVAAEAKGMQMQLGRMESRIARAVNLSTRFRDQAAKKKIVEMDRLRKSSLKVIRYHQKKSGNLSSDALFSEFDKDGDEKVTEKEWVAFFAKADKEVVTETRVEVKDEEGAEKAEGAEAKFKIEESTEKVELAADELKRLFAELIEKDFMTKDDFMRFTRIVYKVVKETTLTKDISIKDTETLRKLEVGEAVELLQGPMRDSSSDLDRILARTINDDLKGYVTVSGNQGTAFLQETRGIYKVVKDTILTESFEIDLGKDATRKLKDTTRKLKEGELLEVYAWPRKEETSGLLRMQAKVKGDDKAFGWVTTVSNATPPTVFCEVI